MLRSNFVEFLIPILKWQITSSPNFVSFFSFIKDCSFVFFFSLNNIYLAQKKPIKMEIFEIFECSGQNLSNSLCQFINDESIPFQILYPSVVSWKITPLCFFSSNNIYFAQKGHVKMKIFETYKCSGKNSSNSSSFSVMKDNSFVFF